ncbi:hypothetical protein OK006_8162 [Actinobacteria bacterium OK006]|nr:hypothetical protein OK006_8162 [Actinobacteria bacterium OK006]
MQLLTGDHAQQGLSQHTHVDPDAGVARVGGVGGVGGVEDPVDALREQCLLRAAVSIRLTADMSTARTSFPAPAIDAGSPLFGHVNDADFRTGRIGELSTISLH